MLESTLCERDVCIPLLSVLSASSEVSGAKVKVACRRIVEKLMAEGLDIEMSFSLEDDCPFAAYKAFSEAYDAKKAGEF